MTWTQNLTALPAIKVIYGDTDSVFVMYRGINRDAAIKRGQAAAVMATRAISRRPIKLEYEKCYGRFAIQVTSVFSSH